MAREIEVRPDRTVITYSHIAVTVRQIMFSPDASVPNTGPIVLFQVDSVHPVDLTFRFTPEMREMWPKPGSGTPSPEWVARGASGFYALHTDFPSLTGAVAIPGSTPGILAPFQERPQVHPLELHLHVDPTRDRNRFFPLLMAVGHGPAAQTPQLAATLDALNSHLATSYAAHVSRLLAQEAVQTSIVTPDDYLNHAFSWAEISIEQLRAQDPTSGQVGLVAGYYASGDSARPGFGWFFGRDTLYTLYAINSFGDFSLTRTAFDFLIARQRVDGKMMHEYSQTAGEMRPPNDWASFPYQYAAADATPLFLTDMLDYVRASGDLAYLRTNKAAVEKAWQFETTHDADGDGIYDNAQGTAWVENWGGGPMPRQEIYLALLDQQASTAMSRLATLLDEPRLASAASERAGKLHAIIEREYTISSQCPGGASAPPSAVPLPPGAPCLASETWDPKLSTYAFSHNPDGTVDKTSTLFPSIAWWNEGSSLDNPATSLRQWASHDFATDWGLRDVAESDPRFDPISYHEGAVWPLFTGWAALAQYRTGHPLAGYAATMQNVELTTAQDLGAVTELLSGYFYEPFGRSTSHQLWSSAMVVTPLMRGLFGLQLDALHHTVRVAPSLPADWPQAEIRQLHVGESVANLTFRRERTTLVVTAETISGPRVALTGPSGDAAPGATLRLPLPAVEVSILRGLPLPGSRTAQLKVLDEVHQLRSLRLDLEAPGGATATLHLQRNDPAAHVHAQNATLIDGDLTVNFPPGPGYQPRTVTLTW